LTVIGGFGGKDGNSNSASGAANKNVGRINVAVNLSGVGPKAKNKALAHRTTIGLLLVVDNAVVLLPVHYFIFVVREGLVHYFIFMERMSGSR
jgi:hypothetical protein